jgi:hypothetical protein
LPEIPFISKINTFTVLNSVVITDKSDEHTARTQALSSSQTDNDFDGNASNKLKQMFINARNKETALRALRRDQLLCFVGTKLTTGD